MAMLYYESFCYMFTELHSAYLSVPLRPHMTVYPQNEFENETKLSTAQMSHISAYCWFNYNLL